jgi:hypothetical protein
MPIPISCSNLNYSLDINRLICLPKDSEYRSARFDVGVSKRAWHNNGVLTATIGASGDLDHSQQACGSAVLIRAISIICTKPVAQSI